MGYTLNDRDLRGAKGVSLSEVRRLLGKIASSRTDPSATVSEVCGALQGQRSKVSEVRDWRFAVDLEAFLQKSTMWWDL
jgi:hypothetical protein